MSMRHIIPISGKDSLCTALVQRVKDPTQVYEYLFCDVGMELPETYAWLSDVEQKLGIHIHRIGNNLETIIAQHNMLPSHQRRFCTREGKIQAINEYIGNDEVTQYLGIRADENRVGAGAFEKRNIHFEYPLRDMGIDLRGVYSILGAQGIMPPSFFWKRLWDAVYAKTSDYMRAWLDTKLTPPVRDILFSWRSRSNCFNCFYQRLYELVGLSEHHPDLFAKYKAMEDRWGDAKSPDVSAFKNADFFWKENWPADRILNEADQIFDRRVRDVCGLIVAAKNQQLVGEDVDLTHTTSCGLYCGK